MEIHPFELQELLKKNERPFLLDVRTENEMDICSISGSYHIPLSELAHRFNEVPNEGTIVVICHIGQRSWMAMQFLRSKGYSSVLNLQGGVDAWAVNIDHGMARY